MKRIMLFAVFALLLFMIVPVQAQTESTTYCGDLSTADCELLTESAAAMQALESTTFSLEADIHVGNIAHMPFKELNFTLSGAGSTAATKGLFAGLKPEDFLGSSEDMLPVVADMLRAVAADMTFTLELPEELRDMMAEQDQALPSDLSLDMRMVDGVAYVNLADIAAASPTANIPPGWIGLDLGELYDTVLPEMMTDMPSTMNFDIVPVMTAMMSPENAEKFMTIKRLEDVEMDGQTMAVLETSLDYVAMLEIPEFQEAVTASAGESADEALAVIQAMYEGLTFVSTQYIGVDDKLIHSTEVQMDWDLAAFGEATNQGDLPELSFNMLLTEESFNDAPDVEVPEDATLLPLQQMFTPPSK
jgi:hypothetical protein